MPIHVVFVDWNSDGKLRTHTHPVHVHLARVDPSAAVRLLLCCRLPPRVPRAREMRRVSRQNPCDPATNQKRCLVSPRPRMRHACHLLRGCVDRVSSYF
jgi:hypothetical protein